MCSNGKLGFAPKRYTQTLKADEVGQKLLGSSIASIEVVFASASVSVLGSSYPGCLLPPSLETISD